MSKITELIRKAPKRFSALAIAVAAAIVVPIAVFAYGPERPTFTAKNPASYVTFNSITDNPQVGDERNFVRIRESGVGDYKDQTDLTPGKVYEVSVYYHNNAASRLNATGEGIAKDTKLRMEVPSIVKPGVNAVLAGNISASNAKPGTVWDEAYGKNTSNGDVVLRYVDDSARVTSLGAVNGAKVPDTLFTTGAHLGYDSLNGEVPGCNEFAGFVTFKIRVDQPNFTLKKEVSVDNGKTWVDGTAKAKAGSTVQYKMTYQNTGTNQQDNVSLRDMLPAGVTYEAGTSQIANSVTKGKYEGTIDGVTTTGYNTGSYQPKGNFFFKFSAKLPTEDKLECGTNTLKNVARVTTNSGYKEDDATVTIDKECKPVVKYSCDNLAIRTISRTEFRFTTNYTAENATFKSVKYTIRNAAGTVVDTKTATTNTLNYTQTTAGKFSVVAEVTFSVNGSDKTVTSNGCKGEFEVPALPNKITVCEIPTKTIITIDEKDFNPSIHTKDLDKCKETPVTPPTPETPPELPQTGVAQDSIAIVGLGALIASIAYFVASRRALNL